MRVTVASQSSSATFLIGQSFSQLVKFQQQVASGKRISKPSDDPVATDQSLSYSQTISDVDQYLRNASLAKDFMGQTSSTLDELYSNVQEVRTLALAANTASASAESRAAAIEKLNAIQTRVTALANTTHLGRFIFSGQRTQSSPLGYAHSYASAAALTSASATGTADLSGGIALGGPANLVFADASGTAIASVTLTNGMTSTQIVDAVNTAFASVASPGKLQASLDASNQLVLTNTTPGNEPVVNISAASDAAALTAVGLSSALTRGTGGFTPQLTSGTLTINGTAIVVTANDTSAALIARINTRTLTTKVSAELDSGGNIQLIQKDSSQSSVMNVSASGGYTLTNIFGASPAETTDISVYTYVGDTGDINMQTGAFSSDTVNRRADNVFNLDGAANASEPDLFALIDQLKSAITSGDSARVGVQLDFVNKAAARLLVQRVDVGARIQNLEGLTNSLSLAQDNLKELRSKAEDVDITQAVVDLKAQEQVYQASLYSASSMFKLSLLDFLR